MISIQKSPKSQHNLHLAPSASANAVCCGVAPTAHSCRCRRNLRTWWFGRKARPRSDRVTTWKLLSCVSWAGHRGHPRRPREARIGRRAVSRDNLRTKSAKLRQPPTISAPSAPPQQSRAILPVEVQARMPNLLGDFSAFSATSAVQIRGADSPAEGRRLSTDGMSHKQGGQRGGHKTCPLWPPWAGDLNNAVPPANLWPNVRITKAINRGVSKNDRLDRLRPAGSKTRLGSRCAVHSLTVVVRIGRPTSRRPLLGQSTAQEQWHTGQDVRRGAGRYRPSAGGASDHWRAVRDHAATFICHRREFQPATPPVDALVGCGQRG